MEAKRVLIADNVDVICETLLRDAGVQVDRQTGKSPEELIELVPDFDAMVVRSGVKVTSAMIDAMDRMEVIGRAGAGVDNIDVEAATRRGILVMNTPGGNTISAAEHTVGMILSLCRKIPFAHASLRSGEWNRKAFAGTELLDKTVGIIGVGRIGTEVAARLKPFGVRIVGFDGHATAEAVSAAGIEAMSQEELLQTSDIVTLHLPLDESTKGSFDRNVLRQMKEGAFLINCSRGGIVDEVALAELLESGHLGGAAIDVYESEPPEFPNELISRPDVVVTPHIAASTREAQHRVARAIAHQIVRLFEGDETAGLVNAEGLEGAMHSRYAPYALATRRLGCFAAGLAGAKALKVRLHVRGDESAVMREGLGASFLSGMFGSSDARVNPVNAYTVASENGVEIEASSEGPDEQFHFLVTADIETGEETHRAGMSVFGRNRPRLVMLDDRWIDFDPDGHITLLWHSDVPGTLARITSILGDANVNITDVTLGQGEGRDDSVALIRTDSFVGDSTQELLWGVESIRRVASFTL
jgi:D-3-phosphoglycerate dehydrogenase